MSVTGVHFQLPVVRVRPQHESLSVDDDDDSDVECQMVRSAVRESLEEVTE